MAFSISTNLTALQAYNALSQINSETQKTQTRLATGKRINSVADDTSGYRVGKSLESKATVLKSQLNNASSAQNYLQTAETSLELVSELLTQIAAKYTDSQDQTKNKAAIASDIRLLASELDAILKNTSLSGKNILTQADGSALTSSHVFDIGETVTMDFAGDTYLKANDLKTALHGGEVTDPGVDTITGSPVFLGSSPDYVIANPGAEQTSTVAVTFADGSSTTFDVTLSSGATLLHASQEMNMATAGSEPPIWTEGFTPAPHDVLTQVVHSGVYDELTHTTTPGSNITSLTTTSGIDITTMLGITRESSSTTDGGLMDEDTATVINAASNISALQTNVQNALGRIGTIGQTVEVRSSFLTESITNCNNTVSKLFDADMAKEQLNSTKGDIASQIGTTMFSQSKLNPQLLLSLFRQ